MIYVSNVFYFKNDTNYGAFQANAPKSFPNWSHPLIPILFSLSGQIQIALEIWL